MTDQEFLRQQDELHARIEAIAAALRAELEEAYADAVREAEELAR